MACDCDSIRLKLTPEILAGNLLDTDIFALQRDGDSDWYHASAAAIKEFIGNPTSVNDDELITTNLQVYKDPADNVISDGIDIFVRNTDTNIIMWRIDGTFFAIASPQSLTLAAPDSTYSRFDLIYLTNTGTIEVATGTPALNPIKPALPGNSIAVSFILVTIDGNITITPISVVIFQVNEEYILKATDITQTSIDITLNYEIRENFHVFAFINGMMLNKNRGYSYIEGTNIVTINFDDSNDFKYKPQLGWPIQIYYTRKEAIAVETDNIWLTSVLVNISPETDDLTFTLYVNNENSFPVDCVWNLRLTDSNDNLISETTTIYEAPIGNSTYIVPTYQNLAPETYTLTVTGQTPELSGNNSETIVLETPTYQNIYDAWRTSDTTIAGSVAVENLNNTEGNVTRKIAIDGGTKNTYTKYIAPGYIETFLHEFTGLSTDAHVVYYYDENDNLLNTINVPAIPVSGIDYITLQYNNGSVSHFSGYQDGTNIRTKYEEFQYYYESGLFALTQRSDKTSWLGTGVTGIEYFFLRLLIDNYTTVSNIEFNLYVHNYEGNPIDYIECYLSPVDISAVTMGDIFDITDNGVDLINSVIYNPSNKILQIILNSAGNSAFEGIASGYIDIYFRFNGEDNPPSGNALTIGSNYVNNLKITHS